MRVTELESVLYPADSQMEISNLAEKGSSFAGEKLKSMIEAPSTIWGFLLSFGDHPSKSGVALP